MKEQISLKKILLDKYKECRPNAYIEISVFSDPDSFNYGLLLPDEDGYCVLPNFTHELMDYSGVKILFNPEKPKDMVIRSLEKAAERIRESTILEENLELYKKEERVKEIKQSLKASGYTEEEISNFCRLYQSGHCDFEDVEPF